MKLGYLVKKHLLKVMLGRFKKFRLSLKNYKGQGVMLVCLPGDIDAGVNILENSYNKRVYKVCVYDQKNDCLDIDINKNDKNIAVYINSKSNFAWISIVKLLDKVLKNPYYLFSDTINIDHFEMPSQEKFVCDNLKKIFDVYHLLEDKHSKDVFLRDINKLYYGNSDCILDEEFEQYNHPKVHAENADCIISGGLGVELWDSEMFCAQIKEKGHIHCFEPIASNVEIINNLLNHSDIKDMLTINPKGLWCCDDILYFSDAKDASTTSYDNGEKINKCEVTTIDNYVCLNNLEKVNLIKLDIEGAELEALKGAINTISRFRPKLAISVYHLPEHILSIIDYINSLGLKYKFYFGHHSNRLGETVLYAISETDEKRLLRRNRFDKRFNMLKEKVKNKKVVIYGANSILDEIQRCYNLEDLNVVAISDSKFVDSDISLYKGFKSISPIEIKTLNPDFVFVCNAHSMDEIEYLRYQLLVDTDIKVLPLVKRSLISTIKEIWK